MSGATILVVDDEPGIRALLKTTLESLDVELDEAQDAASAVFAIKARRPDAIVLDVNLPGISGLELLELLRKDPQWDEPPVLLMSAHPEQAGVTTAMREGLVTKLVRKPFDVEQLVREVHAAVGTHVSEAPRPRGSA